MRLPGGYVSIPTSTLRHTMTWIPIVPRADAQATLATR